MSAPNPFAPLLEHPLTWDSDQLVCFLEPRLPLIKSRTLNAFYHEMKYGTPVTASAYLPLLIADATQDYRLERLLLEVVSRFL